MLNQLTFRGRLKLVLASFSFTSSCSPSKEGFKETKTEVNLSSNHESMNGLFDQKSETLYKSKTQNIGVFGYISQGQILTSKNKIIIIQVKIFPCIRSFREHV